MKNLHSALLLSFWFVFACAGHKSAMEKQHYKVVVWEQLTGLAFKKDSSGTVTGFSGVAYDIISWLSRRLKFTYTAIPVFQYRSEPLPNGTWIGAHEMLRKKEVDFSLSIFLVTREAYGIMDFTTTAAEIPVVLLVPPPEEESRLVAPVKPFTDIVWIMLICSLAILAVITYGLFYVMHRFRGPRFEMRISDIFTSILSVMLSQSEFSLRVIKPLWSRVALGVFCLTAVVLVNSYNSCFISFATTPKLLPVAEDMESAAFRAELRYVATPAQRVSWLLATPNRAMKKFGEQVQRDPSSVASSLSAAADKVATKCCTILFPKNILEAWLAADYKRTGKCRCAITKVTEFTEFYAIGVQKNSPYTDIISQELLIIKQFGLLDYWWRKELKVPYECQNPPKSKVRPLTVADLSGVFVFFAGGILCSALAFVGERLMSRIAR